VIRDVIVRVCPAVNSGFRQADAMVERYTEWADWTDQMGRVGGQETTSGDWTDQTDEYLHVAKVTVAGSNPVVRSL
jgi:hypothetical protein